MAAVRDPMEILAVNIKCEPPPGGITREQAFALHEFFHEVLAAGYRLYQVVPPKKAAPIIKAKFGLILDDPTC
jgi:hypothetical protein